jgi:hypothetical protein
MADEAAVHTAGPAAWQRIPATAALGARRTAVKNAERISALVERKVMGF